MRAWSFVAVLAALAFSSPAGAGPNGDGFDRSAVVKAQYGSTVYHWCLLAKPPYGETVYFSRVFGVAAGTYVVGIQNDFNAHVGARWDADAFSGSICMGPYPTADEARYELDSEIGDRRRSGKAVVLTGWGG